MLYYRKGGELICEDIPYYHRMDKVAIKIIDEVNMEVDVYVYGMIYHFTDLSQIRYP